MNKLIALSVVAAFALGACASQPGPSQQKVFTNVYPYTPGQGTVTAVMPAPGQGSAAAGAGATAPIQRLEIKMDGTVQSSASQARISPGTRQPQPGQADQEDVTKQASAAPVLMIAS
jgi:hypothetical protein